jgi:pyruvate kinase
VANAIYDGTDAVMLSGETAAGKYPVETVAMMANIVAETEYQIRLDPPLRARRLRTTRLSVAETICECMAHSAEDLELAAIAIFTETGLSGRLLSKYRPEPPIFALSPDQNVINRSMLLWGTYPILCARFSDTDQLVRLAEETLVERNVVQGGQIVGIVAGTQSRTGATNFMRLHTIGEREARSSVKAKKLKKAKKKK